MAETFRLRGIHGVVHARSHRGWKTFCGIEVMQYNGLHGPVRAQVDCIDCLATDDKPYLVPEGFVWLKDDPWT